VSHQDLQNNLSFQTRLSGDRIPESMPPISRMNISKYQRERENEREKHFVELVYNI